MIVLVQYVVAFVEIWSSSRRQNDNCPTNQNAKGGNEEEKEDEKLISFNTQSPLEHRLASETPKHGLVILLRLRQSLSFWFRQVGKPSLLLQFGSSEKKKKKGIASDS